MCGGGNLSLTDEGVSPPSNTGIDLSGVTGRIPEIVSPERDPFRAGGSSPGRAEGESGRTETAATVIGGILGLSAFASVFGGGGAATTGGGEGGAVAGGSSSSFNTFLGLLGAGGQVYSGIQQQRAAERTAEALEDQARAFNEQQERQAEALRVRAITETSRATRRSDELVLQGSILRRQQILRAELEKEKAGVALDQSVRVAAGQTRRGELIKNESTRTAELLFEQATRLDDEAEIQLETAQIRDELFRLKTEKALSATIVKAAKGGVIGSTGSPLDNIAEMGRLIEFESRLNLREAAIVSKRTRFEAAKTRKSASNVLLRGLEQEMDAKITAEDIITLGAENFRVSDISVNNILQSGIDAEEQNIRQAEEAIKLAEETSRALTTEAKDLDSIGDEAIATGLFNSQAARDAGSAALTASSVNALSTILSTQSQK